MKQDSKVIKKYNKKTSIVFSIVALVLLLGIAYKVSNYMDELKLNKLETDYKNYKQAVSDYYDKNKKLPNASLDVVDFLDEVPDVPPVSTKIGSYKVVKENDKLNLEVSSVVLKESRLKELVKEVGEENIDISNPQLIKLNLLEQ